jgi:hypothetical protein
MLHEERVTYQTLKSWALDDYFNFCRDSGLVDHWPHEQVLARVAYSFEDGFERPIEDFMWNVILLVLSGGWHPEWSRRQHKLIADLITEHGLENLLADVPADESEAFRHDLKILKLIAD